MVARKYRSKSFDYSLEYAKLDLRKKPSLYRVGRGEQGVLLVEPYKSEILPYWRFKDPKTAKVSAAAISRLFRQYRKRGDFIGMDMARKFLQMGFTRARRYANHPGGRKYSPSGKVLPYKLDATKAEAAKVFYRAWQRAESDPIYSKRKVQHKFKYG
jgi:hypothetical protein